MGESDWFPLSARKAFLFKNFRERKLKHRQSSLCVVVWDCKNAWTPLWVRYGRRCGGTQVLMPLLLPQGCLLSPRDKLVRKLCHGHGLQFQKDIHKTKGSHLPNENYPKQLQRKIPEGACWLDQRHKGNESQLVTQSERTSVDACQDSESHYEKNLSWWGVKDSKVFQSRLQMKIHSDSLTCTVLQRLSRLLPSILSGWSHHCRCLCKLF